jgi:hypothetical protein
VSRTLWEIKGDDRFQIPQILKDWGYPRELADGELGLSWWYGFGDDVLFWYNAMDGLPKGTAMLHACIRPDARKRAVNRKALYAIEIIPELRGMDSVVADPPSVALRDALLRRGWRLRQDGRVERLLGDTWRSVARLSQRD